MKSIAVVILNWNGVELLKRFLPGVVKFSKEAHIYIADNASTDTSKRWTQENYPEITWLGLDKNHGFAEGYNQALKNVEEPLLALVNSDVEVTENWLQPILHTFETIPNASIIQPKILDLNAPEYFEYAGAGGGFIDALGYPFCRGRIFDSLEKDKGQYNDTIKIFWASGACFFIKNNVFRELGGFDATFFAHQEEVDLCWRAFHRDYSVYYCGQSTIYHLGGATLSNISPKKTYLNFRNSLFMLMKNLPGSILIPVLFCRMLLDGIAGIRFLLKGQFPHFMSIIKSHLSFYFNICQLVKKRKKISFKRYYYTPSIVFDFYVKGQKLFNN